jgi:hypothetical protein
MKRGSTGKDELRRRKGDITQVTKDVTEVKNGLERGV